MWYGCCVEKYRTQIVVEVLIGAIGTGMAVVFPVYQLYVLVVTTTTMILVVLLWPKEHEVLENLGTQPASFIIEKTTATPQEIIEVKKRQQLVRQGWRVRKEKVNFWQRDFWKI